MRPRSLLAIVTGLLLLLPSLATAAETAPADSTGVVTAPTDPMLTPTDPGTGDPTGTPVDPVAEDPEEEDDGPWGTVVSVVPVLSPDGQVLAYSLNVLQPDGTIQNVVVAPDAGAEFRAWEVPVSSLQPGDALRLNNTGLGIQLRVRRTVQQMEGTITAVTPPSETDPGSVTVLVDGTEVTVPLTGALAGLADSLQAGYKLELKSAGNLVFKAKVKTEQGTEVSFELKKGGPERKVGQADGEDETEFEDGADGPDEPEIDDEDAQLNNVDDQAVGDEEDENDSDKGGHGKSDKGKGNDRGNPSDDHEDEEGDD
ncbi:hypothetical protein caldi_35260 [Caldinitratiruptor microaerophilus]|uniref:Uncharacterized protein n=2 Tax=Caldinitratiruptor microaerophilus TaxID=671077 RepID=A0AA35G9U3_9FIRM|nr:hypothetical protein caldi_35260 [Caldinitratiruptor microaerophilus]